MDAVSVNSVSAQQICDFLAFFASAGLHRPHSAQIERHANELELSLCFL